MARAIEIDSGQLDWTPTGRPGLARKLLRRDEATGARTFLLRLDADSRLPRHLHPAGEEVFVLEGQVRFEETWYHAGHYLYSPPDSRDEDVYTDTGAVLLVMLPKPHVDLE